MMRQAPIGHMDCDAYPEDADVIVLNNRDVPTLHRRLRGLARAMRL